MKVTAEVSASDFQFWGGACQTFDALEWEEIQFVWECLEELYPEGLTETEINDIFWFETDWIAEILGFESWEQLWVQR